MQTVAINNQTRPLQEPIKVLYCESFASRLRGLMFRPSLSVNEGILLVEERESRINSSIHMFFMNFDICVVWMDDHFSVVDQILARRWRPYYAPSNPARYIMEIHPDHLEHFKTGDQIHLEYA